MMHEMKAIEIIMTTELIAANIAYISGCRIAPRHSSKRYMKGKRLTVPGFMNESVVRVPTFLNESGGGA